ncbi:MULTISPECIES: hypothetical protein [unclassified Rhizobium]|uniref:hypothetical protein n=1 Tax=unclassified Rhizobium TaxID=2613769 RepID=UPI00115D5A2E|nr:MULTISPECIES: hypothetical protein [unclassified Rhizobium]TQX90238.1 hypothetical protein EQW76_11080 [Rhizobium sp. rho-13.1]TQY16188.1 hypothetical protein EQW74_10670 [Rhizobium sp. rho-1.1]
MMTTKPDFNTHVEGDRVFIQIAHLSPQAEIEAFCWLRDNVDHKTTEVVYETQSGQSQKDALGTFLLLMSSGAATFRAIDVIIILNTDPAIALL